MSPFFGIFVFFVFFNFLIDRKRIKECYVTKEERVSQTSILVPSAWNILMLIARKHVKEKDTRGKFLHVSRCEVAEARSVARLAYKE